MPAALRGWFFWRMAISARMLKKPAKAKKSVIHS